MMKNNIQKILVSNLGLTPNLIGFRYISESVKIIIESEEYYKVTELYNKIAAVYNKQPCQIERSIRHAKSKIDYNSDIAKKYCLNLKMTNGEFLYVLAMNVGKVF